MSQAEKSTWSTDTSELCPLCGATDTKEHRLYECMPLASTREPYSELLSRSREDRPWWPHMFAASEHADTAMFRLISTWRPFPSVPTPLQWGHVQLFTDGSARHSSCPTARQTYWSVVRATGPGVPVNVDAWVRLSAQERLAIFQVVCMAATPGEQTVPRAELAALAWAAQWLGNCSGKLEFQAMSEFAKYLVEVNIQEVRLKEVIRLQQAEDIDNSLVLPSGIQEGD